MNIDLESLQELSLKVITLNFEKYAYAYFTTTDDCLKRNLHFLQRVYTRSLLTELGKTEQLREEHFDILLNEHLKELDLGIICDVTVNDQIVLDKLKLIGHSITELSCSNHSDKSVLKALLPHIPNVTKLFIPYVCDEEILQLISLSCSNITTLDMQHSYIPKLTVFFDSNLELCPNLKKLFITISTAYELKLFYRLPQLECLHIEVNSWKDNNWEWIDLSTVLLGRGSILKELHARCLMLSVSTLIENCPYIESLVLNDISYQKIDRRISKTLDHLKTLEIDQVLMTHIHYIESVVALLSSSSNLKRLTFLYSIDFFEVVDKISAFPLNCKLENLSFISSDINVDLLHQIILNCNSLKSLSLQKCKTVKDDDINKLEQTIMSSKRKIDLYWDNDYSDSSSDDYGSEFLDLDTSD